MPQDRQYHAWSLDDRSSFKKLPSVVGFGPDSTWVAAFAWVAETRHANSQAILGLADAATAACAVYISPS